MKLNLDVIMDHLPQEYKVERFGLNNSNLSYRRPHLYDSDTPMEKGEMLVCSTDSLPSQCPPSNTALICVGDPLSMPWDYSRIQVLFVTTPSSVLSVFSLILSIYDRFDDWDTKFRDELEEDEGFDIKRVLELGALMLNRRIAISNQDLQIILHASVVKNADGSPLVTVSDEVYSLPLEQKLAVKDVCQYECQLTAPFISSIRPEYSSYCHNLRPFGYFAGCISVQDISRSFRQSDFFLANMFFLYFEKAFKKFLAAYHTSSHHTSSLLLAILKDKELSKDEYRHFSLLPGERWLFFHLTPCSSKYLPANYMLSTLNTMFPTRLTAAFYENHIVGLLKVTSEAKSYKEEATKLLQSTLQQMGYASGLSNPFSEITLAAEYFSQTSYLIKNVIHPDTCTPDCRLYFFDDYLLDFMLSNCCAALPIEQLCSSRLHILLEHDKTQNSNYLETLNVYLKNEMNVTRTAEILYLHRSGLIKRLHKMTKLLGTDLNDPDVRLYLRLYLRLLESKNEKSNH